MVHSRACLAPPYPMLSPALHASVHAGSHDLESPQDLRPAHPQMYQGFGAVQLPVSLRGAFPHCQALARACLLIAVRIASAHRVLSATCWRCPCIHICRCQQAATLAAARSHPQWRPSAQPAAAMPPGLLLRPLQWKSRAGVPAAACVPSGGASRHAPSTPRLPGRLPARLVRLALVAP